MKKPLRVGDQVFIKSYNEEGQYVAGPHSGKITGIGHAFVICEETEPPTVAPYTVFIVRLDNPFVVSPDDRVHRLKAPSAFHSSLFVFELALSEDQLALKDDQ